MAAVINASRPKDAGRVAVLWSTPLKLVTDKFRQSRFFAKRPARLGGMVAMPQRSIAREIEELFPEQY
ncbi:MAG TPA: hypothetical protein VMT64_15500 [Candidatus Binataceae bacterium]|nr:hypothetical protein [Candidatus Binataceae bacterium]